MEFKLIEVDNKESKGFSFIGVVGKFTYYGKVFYFSNLYSSTVKSITVNEDVMIVVTKNTTYTFKQESK